MVDDTSLVRTEGVIVLYTICCYYQSIGDKGVSEDLYQMEFLSQFGSIEHA